MSNELISYANERKIQGILEQIPMSKLTNNELLNMIDENIDLKTLKSLESKGLEMNYNILFLICDRSINISVDMILFFEEKGVKVNNDIVDLICDYKYQSRELIQKLYDDNFQFSFKQMKNLYGKITSNMFKNIMERVYDQYA